MSPRKIWTIATTEFGSAVRTKSFLIGILLLPIIMGASILLQTVVAQRADTKPRRVAVLDRTGALYPALAEAAGARNRATVGPDGRPKAPPIALEPVDPAGRAPEAIVLALSDRIRKGELDAYVAIPEGIVRPAGDGPPAAIAYHSDNPNDDVARDWLGAVVNDQVRARRFREAGLDQGLAQRLSLPVNVENLGLADRAAGSAAGAGDGSPGGAPAVKAAQRVDPIRTAAVPAVLLFVTFFVIMTSAPQLLNSVMEEKLSKISEVLLGSVTPFELMMGKLLGNLGIAMVLAGLYIGSAYGVATYYGYGDVLSPGLLAAFALFLVLAILLYGSLYMAVGAACSELKDAQSLMMPVMLCSMLPIFVWTAVLRNPASPLSVGMSLFPPATPFLMLMRMALSPAPPAWQVVLSVILTTLTALACVWAAGKIFRIGILSHGKTPSFRELARWVVSG
jgi:ABC-type Na+ efflux pump permease subunit